jgi:predicted AAA+ superfamily ATPase
MYIRSQNFAHAANESFFLWGARQTGKSTLLKRLFPNNLYLDLLQNDVFRRYILQPERLRERVLAERPEGHVIIDEIQKIPALLDEVHWLIENGGYRFILSGSSPRKLLRAGVNLLGGRALRYELYPLSFSEIPDFDLMRALQHGLLPRHYCAAHPRRLLEAYISSYLQEEIMAESRLRRLDVFARFLHKAALCNGELMQYTNIASDCGVSSNTVKEYFHILKDTLLGTWIEPYQKRPKRRSVNKPKFYFFDVGLANHLAGRFRLAPGTPEFGQAFEHLIFHELRTYSHYSGKNFPIAFWRTSSGLEVDFVLGDHEVAVEVKSATTVHPRHLRHLRALGEEYSFRLMVLVSLDPEPRLTESHIHLMPWKQFLEALWRGEIM